MKSLNHDFFLETDISHIIDCLHSGKIDLSQIYDLLTNLFTRHDPNYHFATCADFTFFKTHSTASLKGPLMGIPYMAKDIYNTKAFPTQMGSKAWEEFMPGNNARVIDSLSTNGACLVGKTGTAEFAIHSLNETINPHHPLHSPGTSSSGSAVSVALGVVPFSLATQTAASIVRPASFCGVFGFKPTLGLIPRTGILKTTDTLDSPGFITSRATSLKPLLDSARVTGHNYPKVHQLVDQAKPQPKPYKIGFLKTSFFADTPIFIANCIHSLINSIDDSPFVQLEILEDLEEFKCAHRIHQLIYSKCISHYFKREYLAHKDKISDLTLELINQGSNVSPDEYNECIRWQSAFMRKFNDYISSFDAVITLATTSTAPFRNKKESVDPSLIWTLAGAPSITVPAGYDANNLPFGIQFIAAKYKDYNLISVINHLAENGLIHSRALPIALLD